MKPTRWLRRAAGVAGIGTVTSALALTTRYLLQTPQPLQSAMPGAAHIDREHSGDIYYTTDGQPGARSLVLLHDFYPGASSYQYASVLPRLAREFRVYAPDWLGFGMSEHPELAYTGEFYAGILAGFLRDVVAQPALVVASGRAANVAARAASDAPELFDRLVLVSPRLDPGWHLDPTLVQALIRLAQRASLGIVPYALLSTRPVLRLLARRRGLGASSEDVLDHQYAAAHQFGAQFAVLAALTGELDLPLQHMLPTIEPPVLLVSGEQDARCAREHMEELAVLRPYTDLTIVPGAGAAVLQDQPARCATLLSTWIQRELPRHASTDTLRAGSPEATAVGMPGAPRPTRSTRTHLRVATAGATAAAHPTPQKVEAREESREQGESGAHGYNGDGTPASANDAHSPEPMLSTRSAAHGRTKKQPTGLTDLSQNAAMPSGESPALSTGTAPMTGARSSNGRAKSTRRLKAEGIETPATSANEKTTGGASAQRKRKSPPTRKRETGEPRARQAGTPEDGDGES